jgi:hypothetical protein
MTAALAAAATSLIVQLVVVCAVAAIVRRGNIYLKVIVVSVLTLPVVIRLGPADAFGEGGGLGGDGVLYLAFLHLALGGLLFHFMTLPDRSVTLRMLVELWLAPGHTLSLDDLARRYSVKAMIESRLAQLAAGRFLATNEAGEIRLLPRGLAFGRFVTAGRALFRIQSAN